MRHLILLLFLFCGVTALASDKLDQGELFIIQNEGVSITFKQTGTALVLSEFKDNLTGKIFRPMQSAGLKLGELTTKLESVSVTQTEIGVTEFLLEYPQIKVKQVCRTYVGIPVVAFDYFVQSKKTEIDAFNSKTSELISFKLKGKHWQGKSIEFFDKTDHNNTLVKEELFAGIKSEMHAKGNIFKFENPISKEAFFVLKEAPTAYAHLYYPGYDFKIGRANFAAVGVGLDASDLIPDKWIKAYGILLGSIGNDELDWLTTIRNYQKQSRAYSPEIDDMVMMNTWGDRNKDARVSEAFILDELKVAADLGITHYQIDDGWQQALSMNSADPSGNVWDLWKKEDWNPHKTRFPNGLEPVVKEAKKQNIKLGLWFHPSNHNDYENWVQDAEIVVSIFQKYGIQYFKIDGVKLKSKKADINLRAFFDKVKKDSKGKIYLNLDATADQRVGYHYCYEYGNIFLENRYSDWLSYYPYWTLRNLWMLSKYIPAEKLQIEFLNKWRNADKYGKDDPLAPFNIPFEYQFAISMAAQPLAWFEASGIPEKSTQSLSPLVKEYQHFWNDFHSGTILPIGDEPSGTSWTGFQSIGEDDNTGYLLLYREFNDKSRAMLNTYLEANSKIELIPLLGDFKANSTKQIMVSNKQEITVELDNPHSFVLYKYRMIK